MRMIGAFLLLASSLLAADSTTYFVTVAGLGGEPEYEQRFSSQATEVDKLLKSANAPGLQVETLSGKGATKAALQAALAKVAHSATAQDSLVLLLIGHGTFDGVDYKLALPGPDVSGPELASMLDKIPASRQLVVNTTSSSGGSIMALRKANRTVIAATKTGTEKNATVFARYFIEALRDPSADTDKNEVVTALEAFRYADKKTKDFYDTQKRIATEHPTLEDTGKGQGTRTPGADNGEGLTAARFTLVRLGSLKAASTSPEKQQLLRRREELERKIDELKYQKAAMPNDDYKRAMSAALLELARVQAEIDK